MTTVLLVRHGRTAANASGTLAGWSPGVDLDDSGIAQATALSERLAAVPLAKVVSSPLDRARQTAEIMLGGRDVEVVVDDRVGECHYGFWTGQSLKTLAKDPLWKAVQAHPSSVTFPDGESMLQMQHRAVSAIREWNESLPSDAVYAVVSHGDVIKAILADALGLHLDQFQRISVDPCSVSIIDYQPLRPFVHRTNDTGGSLDHLGRRRRKATRKSDAAVGGGAGA